MSKVNLEINIKDLLVKLRNQGGGITSVINSKGITFTLGDKVRYRDEDKIYYDYIVGFYSSSGEIGVMLTDVNLDDINEYELEKS